LSLLAETAGRPSTGLERSLLPNFARWFLGRLEKVDPDFIVPAETKGARLLDVVLDYLREEFGVVIDIPVIYRPALAYIDPEVLGRSRILVLDDARRTGTNYNLHLRRLAEFGATDVHAAICVCLDAGEGEEPLDSFLVTSEEALYQEYIREMTELVVARGLPPEVDHLVFELQTPGPLLLAWPRIEALLASYGDLGVDAPRSEAEELRPLTLHDPRLPGCADFPTEGCARNDGARKIRAFPDPDRNRTMLVPVSFPTLDLPPEAAEQMDPETVERFVSLWAGAREGIAGILLEKAHSRDPETLFRALATFSELDLTLALARVLAGAFPGEHLTIRVERRLLDRLFGAEVASLLSAEIAGQLAKALELPIAPSTPLRRPHLDLVLDGNVVSASIRIVDHLSGLYKRRRDALGGDPPERVGRSLAGLSTDLHLRRLLVSRCIDFGLALTTLVPYVDVERRPNGRLRVERRYRVSEQGDRGMKASADRQVDNERIAQEVLAYTALHLRKRVDRYEGALLPAEVGIAMMAIMRPLLGNLNIRVRTRAEPAGLQVEVRNGAGTRSLGTEDCLAYRIEEGDSGPAIEPTEDFLADNRNGSTMIDRRAVTLQVEGVLDALRPLFADDVDGGTLSDLLKGATLSSAGPLGLASVQLPLERALDRIEAALVKMVARTESAGPVSQTANLALMQAEENLALLATDWYALAAEKLADPTKIEARLLRSMGVPEDELGPVYLFPRALIAATSALRDLTDRLIEGTRRIDDDAEGVEALAAGVLAGAVSLAQALTSLREPVPPARLEGSAGGQVSAAARALLDTVSVTRAFAAAIAIEYRGPRRGEPIATPTEPDRFTTILFPDLAGSKKHSRGHTFDRDFAWKSKGLALFAQWGRAFGGLEARKREGDCLWHEFDQRGDPALLCASQIRVHAAALEALGDPALAWPAHMAIHFGRVKDDDGENTIGNTVDEMNALCKLGEVEEGHELVSVTQDVIESCSRELGEADIARRIESVQGDLPPRVIGLWTVRAATAVRLHAAHLESVSGEILDLLPERTDVTEERPRRENVGEAVVEDEAAETA
jgi:hypothetical protein